MAGGIFYELGQSLFGFGGKDRYTQTSFGGRRYSEHQMLMKGEKLVDTSWGNLADLVNTTPQLSAVINRRGSMLSNGRWREYRLVNGKKEVVDNSAIVGLLENPNPLQNGNSLVQAINFAYCAYGTSIIYFHNAGLFPLSVYALPMGAVKIETTGNLYKQSNIDEIIKSVKTTINGQDEYYDIMDLVWLKMENSSTPILGVSPLEELKLAISNIRGALGFRNRIITNDAMLGVLSSDFMEGMGVGLDLKEQQRLQQGLKEAYGMQSGKGNIAMSQNPVKWTPMSYPTKDLLLHEEVDQNFKIIIDYFGLNEHVFSFSQASTFTNVLEGVKMAYQGCIIPFAQEIGLGFTKQFGMDGVNNWLELDYSHLEILKEDEKAKTENIKRTVESIAILTQNGYTDIANRMSEGLVED